MSMYGYLEVFQRVPLTLTRVDCIQYASQSNDGKVPLHSLLGQLFPILGSIYPN